MNDTTHIEIPLEDPELLADSSFLRLGEFFGLEKYEDRWENKDKLKSILEWARKHAETPEPVDVLLYIKSIERGLGGDSTEPRINRLMRYVALEADQERINKEMELLKGNKDEPQE